MGNEKKTNLSEEYLRKFKHRINYAISETPKYRPLVGTNEEFDEIPKLTTEAGEEEDAKKQGQIPPEPSNDQPIGMDAVEDPSGAPAPEAGGDPMGAPAPPPDGGMPDPMAAPEPVDPMTAPEADPMGAPMPAPEGEVNDLQNDIIKHNIEAMKGIHDQLEGLNGTIQGLNQKMDVLNADVEEVREPTSAEKLMNQSKVSYPYYFNLNDFWQGNWFDEKRKEELTHGGVKELPDGTYVADFDDLPQKSKIDVQDSFNDI